MYTAKKTCMKTQKTPVRRVLRQRRCLWRFVRRQLRWLLPRPPPVCEKSTLCCQKSPIFCQKSPIFCQKSPYKLSRVSKEPCILPKEPYIFIKRVKRAKRTLHSVNVCASAAAWAAALSVRLKSPTFCQKSPTFSQMSPTFCQKSPTLGQKSPVVTQKSPIFCPLKSKPSILTPYPKPKPSNLNRKPIPLTSFLSCANLAAEAT